MRSELRAVRTGGAPVVVDLTEECADFVRQESDGLLHVFVPHATAGVAVIETGGSLRALDLTDSAVRSALQDVTDKAGVESLFAEHGIDY